MRWLLLLLLTACSTVSQPEAFKLSNGELLECRQYEQKLCGMTLRGCGPEHTVEFECMTDVHYVGTGPHPKPDANRCKEALEKKDPKLIQEHRCYPPDYYVDPNEEVTK